jgi:16S rRNA (cytosine967-C5)-methyltransferase
MNIRRLATNILAKTEEQGAYSNLLLRKVLDEQPMDARDAALLTEIVYGTIQQQANIDLYLNKLITKGMDAFAPWLRATLRTAMYQLLYLDKVPDHAVVHEAVELAKKKGHAGIVKLVNGVLRNAIRQRSEWQTQSNDQQSHTMPEWLINVWNAQLGVETTEQMAHSLLKAPHVSVRVNTIRTNRTMIIKKMQDAGLDAQPSPLSQDGIIIKKAGNIARTSWFEEGLISIQDESSMLVARALDAQTKMSVLDCCAAPGGKIAHIAESIDDDGHLFAVDIHPHKESLIHNQLQRLNLHSVTTIVDNALHLPQRFAPATFDRILLDAPCSGLGVIRRKPDIIWRKQASDLEALPEIQMELLQRVSPLLKKDGILVYSTCTINALENEQLIYTFLNNHPDFELNDDWSQLIDQNVLAKIKLAPGMLRILPHMYDSDGFFIAKLQRK